MANNIFIRKTTIQTRFITLHNKARSLFTIAKQRDPYITPWSVMARLFIPSSLALFVISLILLEPSNRLYSVWTCKCAKFIYNHLFNFYFVFIYSSQVQLGNGLSQVFLCECQPLQACPLMLPIQ